MITTLSEFKALNEKSSTVYYHGSQTEFKVGFVLKPQNEYTSSPEVKTLEDLFEKHRPKGKLSRSKSVFLVDDPDLIDYAGGYDDFIYVVEPIGKVEKSDLGWYTEVDTIMHDDYDEADLLQMIRNYWDGVPYRIAEHGLFEYRCGSAVIKDSIA